MYPALTYTLVTILLYRFISAELDFTQEMAKLDFFNPTYLSNFTVFTSRKDRSSPYLTNANATTKHSWGNNVTFQLKYENLRGNKEVNSFIVGVCDGLQWTWVTDWFKAYSNIPLHHCPIPAGSYRYYNVEVPPKNLPFNIFNTDYKLMLTGYLTASKEKLFQLSMMLRNRKKNAKKTRV